MDEHRLGLKPILGKVWAPRGKRPIVRVQHRYEWLYLFLTRTAPMRTLGRSAFACPESGTSQYWLVPEVNVPAFQLVLDGAGWHTSGTLSVPEGIELVFLPPYSPELQPAERLWTLTDVNLRNKHFASLGDLQTTLTTTCKSLEACPDQVRAHILFHWWPRHSV